MVRVFVYEYVTGGGYLDRPLPLALAREGQAMRSALAEDFAALPGVEVAWLCDARLLGGGVLQAPQQVGHCHVVRTPAEERARFRKLAAQCEWTVVIAPEFDGVLVERCRLAEVYGRLLGPPSPLVATFADKNLTADWLAERTLPAARGIAVPAGGKLPQEFPYPAVLKPRDGAGSLSVRLVSPRQAACLRVNRDSRLESFYAGTPASVALLLGPAGYCVLRPCAQRLSGDGKFTYLGGALPLKAVLARRARRLGHRVALALRRTAPPCRGYIGLDMVLGASPADDVVIEINPRLTTSYVGLRAAAAENLAGVMLKLAAGMPARARFLSGSVTFDAGGTVRLRRGTAVRTWRPLAAADTWPKGNT